jgi:hypothetical protein
VCAECVRVGGDTFVKQPAYFFNQSVGEVLLCAFVDTVAGAAGRGR